MRGLPTNQTRLGRTATRALLTGNVASLSIVSLLNDAASEMIYPLLPFFIVGTLGASATALGLIEGVAESTSSFVKLVSGYVSDRARRRKPLVLAGYGIATVARPLIAVATAVWHVLAIRFSDRIGKGLRSAPRDALLADSVDPALRGRAFGVHRAADHLGAVIGPLLGSVLLLVFAGRVRTVFALAFVPGLVSLAIIVFGVREHAAPATPERAPTTDPAGALSAVRGSLARFLGVLLLFSLGNATDAFLLLRAQELGVPLSAIPLLWAVHHVSKMTWSVPGGALADRFGPRRTIVAGWTVYALTYAGFALASSVWHAWALFLIYGLFYGLTEAPEKALIAQLAPAERRGAAFGAYHFVIGIAALPASVLFGVLWQRYGAPTAFWLGATLAALASVLLLLSRATRNAD
jgi:MFS family permease